MSNAACIDHKLYSSSIITDNMICAAAPGKGVCQVSIYIDYYDLNVVTCSKASFRPAILLRESVKKSVENSTLGGGIPDRVIFQIFFKKKVMLKMHFKPL